jgi:Bacteriophage Lambda NinG protein
VTTAKKPKLCPICDQPFIKLNSLQKTCFTPACAIEYVRLNRESFVLRLERARSNDEKKTYRLAKDMVKTRHEWIKEAQRAFNEYIRLRDAQDPCISCGRHHSGQYHAGHFRTTRAAPELRFHEDNAHKQCSACNNHLSGNIPEYRPRLIQKITIDRVIWLEGSHPPKKYSIEELKSIKKYYAAKCRELRGNQQKSSF